MRAPIQLHQRLKLSYKVLILLINRSHIMATNINLKFIDQIRYTPLLPLIFLTLLVITTFSSSTSANQLFSDGAEWIDINDATTNGPWDFAEGAVSISTEYAHTGDKSLSVAYTGNESQAFIAIKIPNACNGCNSGETHVFLRWWELRTANYDWSGEKFNRVMGIASNGNVTIDYPLGWVADGGWGQPGTNGPGSIQMFGNSSFSNGLTHWKYTYAMPSEEWHMFEYELKLNDVGVANGETRLWIDNELVASKTGVELRFSNHTIDRIWIGGWYSGGIAPEPSPAIRYIDDITVSTTKTGAVIPQAPPYAIFD